MDFTLEVVPLNSSFSATIYDIIKLSFLAIMNKYYLQQCSNGIPSTVSFTGQ